MKKTTKQKTYATEESVTRAREMLRKLGITDSVRNIRNVLGGGSHKTICRILRKLKLQVYKKGSGVLSVIKTGLEKTFQTIGRPISTILNVMHRYMNPLDVSASAMSDAPVNTKPVKSNAPDFITDELLTAKLTLEKAKIQGLNEKLKNERKIRRKLQAENAELLSGHAQIVSLVDQVVLSKSELFLKINQLQQFLSGDIDHL